MFFSQTRKRATQVRQFASRITAIVYSEEDISDIVLNVLLKPSIVDQVNLKAQASGLSVEGWLSKTIESAVQER
jgi:predicted HicB family RNase H-like nuclease